MLQGLQKNSSETTAAISFFPAAALSSAQNGDSIYIWLILMAAIIVHPGAGAGRLACLVAHRLHKGGNDPVLVHRLRQPSVNCICYSRCQMAKQQALHAAIAAGSTAGYQCSHLLAEVAAHGADQLLLQGCTRVALVTAALPELSLLCTAKLR